MNVNWFKNPDHLVYIDSKTGLPELEKTMEIEKLSAAVKAFREAPVKEGITLRGKKRTSVKLFIPDLTFGEHIEMGENVWLYMGEMSECYVIF